MIKPAGVEGGFSEESEGSSSWMRSACILERAQHKPSHGCGGTPHRQEAGNELSVHFFFMAGRAVDERTGAKVYGII